MSGYDNEQMMKILVQTLEENLSVEDREFVLWLKENLEAGKEISRELLIRLTRIRAFFRKNPSRRVDDSSF